MTICVAWIKSTGKNNEELLIASDSRLRSGLAWDCCPKIITLPRTDCAICFEGDTTYSYPMMLQLSRAIDNFPKSKQRFQDIYDFKGFAIDILNSMRDYITDLPVGERKAESPRVSFILGGYSWRKSHFALWTIFYDEHIEKFTFKPINFWRGKNNKKKVVFIGDYIDEAKLLLIDLLKERDKLLHSTFDMEPFEILVKLLKEKNRPLIGGPPQLIKIYRHMNVLPISVKWKMKGKETYTLLGRPLLDFEKSDHPIIDPATLKIKKLENMEL